MTMEKLTLNGKWRVTLGPVRQRPCPPRFQGGIHTDLLGGGEDRRPVLP